MPLRLAGIMMQASKALTRHHPQGVWEPVTMRVQSHGKVRGQLRDAWPQGHVGTAGINQVCESYHCQSVPLRNGE